MASMSATCVGKANMFVQAPRVVAARPAALQITCAHKTKAEARRGKHLRIRTKINGTEDRPRLCVYRSNKQMYVQVIDDTKSITLAAASTLTKDVRESLGEESAGNKAAASAVGKKIAEVCAAAGITKVCFDRAGYKYHGRVLAVATAAREGGLEF